MLPGLGLSEKKSILPLNGIARIVSRASFTLVTDGSCNNGRPSAQIDPLSPKWALSGSPFGTLLRQSFWALRIQLGNPLPEPLWEIGPASVLTRREHRAFPPVGQMVYVRNACIIERGGCGHDMGTGLKVLWWG
jgi:hypothetical protein